jgi:hypothetical protein
MAGFGADHAVAGLKNGKAGPAHRLRQFDQITQPFEHFSLDLDILLLFSPGIELRGQGSSALVVWPHHRLEAGRSPLVSPPILRRASLSEPPKQSHPRPVPGGKPPAACGRPSFLARSADYDSIVAECVIFVGLPASGKTTFYQQRFSATHRHISKDHWPSASNKEARQSALISAALSENAPVVVDNTNPSIRERASVIALARAHGARVVGYYFTATTREAVGRNRGREGKGRVPDVAIFTKAKHMCPPTAAEGFDELYAVAIGDDGTFDVQ